MRTQSVKTVVSTLTLTLVLVLALPATAAPRERDRSPRSGDGPITRVIKLVKRALNPGTNELPVPPIPPSTQP
jgi:hypothetical protein